MGKRIEMTGKRFGRLKVLSETGSDKWNTVCWLCLCACGQKVIVTGTHLRSGNTKSCGCLQKERISAVKTIHGQTGSRTYKSWTEMRVRCNNPNSKIYKYYGGRGIIICNRWNEFKNFFADMGERPENLSIERINNNKGYSPDNCKWGTRKEQARNSRHNHVITYQGKTQCMSAWAEELGINYKALWARLKNHTVEIAFNI